MTNNTQKEFTLFPYDINPFDVTTFQIQIFNNEDNLNVRMDIHSIEHRFGHYSKYKLQLSKDKQNLQSALKTLRRNYSHIEGIEDYIERIENECPPNSTYSHCRSAERGCNTSYKFCDAVCWNTEEGITLKVFIYEKTFTYHIPNELLDENKLKKDCKGKSAVNHSIKNYDLYDDEFVISDIDKMKSVSKPIKEVPKSTNSNQSQSFKEITEDYSKNTESDTITVLEMSDLNEEPLSEVVELKKLIKMHKNELIVLVPNNERGFPLDYLYQKALKSHIWKSTNDPKRTISDLRKEAKASTY